MFTFKVVEDHTKLSKEYFQFRHKIVCEKLKLKYDENKLDHDEYDPYSIHFIAYDQNNKICATTRLIINPPFLYPTQKYLKIDLELDKNANFSELSRVFIDKNTRNLKDTKEILYRFIKDIYYYLISYKIDFIYAAMEKNFIRYLHILNIHFQIIGKGGEYDGFRYPCLTTKKGLAGKNPYLKNIL